MELCEQAAREQDPTKLLALTQEINRLLEEKDNRLEKLRFRAAEILIKWSILTIPVPQSEPSCLRYERPYSTTSTLYSLSDLWRSPGGHLRPLSCPTFHRTKPHPPIYSSQPF